MKNLGYFVIMFFFLVTISVGQATSKLEGTPSNCEYVRSLLDGAILDSIKLKDSFLFFVHRPGVSENAKVGELRKALIKNQIAIREPNFVQYLVVTGEPRKGLGSLEIYVEGRIAGVIYFGKNKVLENCSS